MAASLRYKLIKEGYESVSRETTPLPSCRLTETESITANNFQKIHF
jgi:hypothetical protein